MKKLQLRHLAILASRQWRCRPRRNSASAQAQRTVKIGMVDSLTGPHSGLDAPASEGVPWRSTRSTRRRLHGQRQEVHVRHRSEEDAQSKPDVAAAARRAVARRRHQDRLRHPHQRPGRWPPRCRSARAKVLYIGGFTLARHAARQARQRAVFRTLDADAIVARSFVQETSRNSASRRSASCCPTRT